MTIAGSGRRLLYRLERAGYLRKADNFVNPSSLVEYLIPSKPGSRVLVGLEQVTHRDAQGVESRFDI